MPHHLTRGMGNPAVAVVEVADILTRVPSELSHRLESSHAASSAWRRTDVNGWPR